MAPIIHIRIEQTSKLESQIMPAIDTSTRDTLFPKARTYNSWQKKDVPDALLKEVYDLMKWGPTSANCSPMRIVFVKSPEAKERLKKYLDKGNIDKTMTAPVTAIIGFDLKFYEHLPKLFPHAPDMKRNFEGRPDVVEEAVWRNGSLQGGYFILAARGLGLDCGPMSGFDRMGASREFWPEGTVEANFLCNLGYGDSSTLYPRGARLTFVETCQVL